MAFLISHNFNKFFSKITKNNCIFVKSVKSVKMTLRESSMEAIKDVIAYNPPTDWVSLSGIANFLKTNYFTTFNCNIFGYSKISLLFRNLGIFVTKLHGTSDVFVRFKIGKTLEDIIFPPECEIFSHSATKLEKMEDQILNISLKQGILEDWAVCNKLIQLRKSAHSRDLEFNLTFRTVKKLLTAKKCYYTGVLFDDSEDNSMSVDRVDADRGYVEGNVVTCTKHINNKKDNFTTKEILDMAKKIIAHEKSQKVKLKTKKNVI